MVSSGRNMKFDPKGLLSVQQASVNQDCSIRPLIVVEIGSSQILSEILKKLPFKPAIPGQRTHQPILRPGSGQEQKERGEHNS